LFEICEWYEWIAEPGKNTIFLQTHDFNGLEWIAEPKAGEFIKKISFYVSTFWKKEEFYEQGHSYGGAVVGRHGGCEAAARFNEAWRQIGECDTAWSLRNSKMKTYTEQYMKAMNQWISINVQYQSMAPRTLHVKKPYNLRFICLDSKEKT
jgi:hypothetical protein